MNGSLSSFTFDADNNQVRELYQVWKDTVWVDHYQLNRTFDTENNLINSLSKKWNGSEWVNSTQTAYIFDYNKNMIGGISHVWKENEWVNLSEYNATHDENNFLQMYSHKMWDIKSSKVITSDSTCFYFHVLNIEKDEPSTEIKIYPNPNNGAFTIASQTPINSIEIFNLKGVKVFSRRKFNHSTLNGVGLADQFKGIFIMKINSGDKIQTKKIMVY